MIRFGHHATHAFRQKTVGHVSSRHLTRMTRDRADGMSRTDSGRLIRAARAAPNNNVIRRISHSPSLARHAIPTFLFVARVGRFPEPRLSDAVRPETNGVFSTPERFTIIIIIIIIGLNSYRMKGHSPRYNDRRYALGDR